MEWGRAIGLAGKVRHIWGIHRARQSQIRSPGLLVSVRNFSWVIFRVVSRPVSKCSPQNMISNYASKSELGDGACALQRQSPEFNAQNRKSKCNKPCLSVPHILSL